MSALEDNTTGGVPNTVQPTAEPAAAETHRDGIEHVKAATEANQTGTSGSAADEGTGTKHPRAAPEPIREEPPASNPGSDDPTGGIGKHAGGVSGAAYVESPVPNEEQSIVNTVKSLLGLGKTEEKKAEETQAAWKVGNVTALAGMGATTTAPVVAVAATSGSGEKPPITSTGSFTAEIPDRTRTAHTGATSSLTSSTSHDRSTPLDSAKDADISTNTSTPPPSSLTNPSHLDSNCSVTAGSHLTNTGANLSANDKSQTVSSTMDSTIDSSAHTNKSTTEDTTVRQQQSADPADKGDHKPPKPADKSQGHGKLENPSAIPTAGGQRLGEEHWGESQIVPDLPPKRESDAGQVSSKDGQPTSEVANNTAANTGGATSGPGHEGASGEKHGVLDTIKDKLNIGKK